MRIEYIDRQDGEKKVEIVAGGSVLNWSYETTVGRGVLELLFKRKIASAVMGWWMDTPFSKGRISSFVASLHIPLEEAEVEDPKGYRTFNDFFYRKLKPGARRVDAREDRFVSPADGRVSLYDQIDIHRLVQVKGMEYTLAELIGDAQLAEEFQGGACLVVRLAPSDYHRYHFPIEGVPGRAHKIKGCYYSVNPVGLKHIAKLYCQNKRELTIIESPALGKVLFIEVGATGVGGIVQTYRPGEPVAKGQEKGYFKFGGSTVMVFVKRDQILWDQDLLENTTQDIETKVHMGEALGRIKSLMNHPNGKGDLER